MKVLAELLSHSFPVASSLGPANGTDMSQPLKLLGTRRIPIAYMVREGLALNLIGAMIITLVCYFLVA